MNAIRGRCQSDSSDQIYTRDIWKSQDKSGWQRLAGHEVIVNSTLKEGSCTWKIRYGNWELI